MLRLQALPSKWHHLQTLIWSLDRVTCQEILRFFICLIDTTYNIELDYSIINL